MYTTKNRPEAVCCSSIRSGKSYCLSFRASTGFSGEPRPEPGEPIGLPLVAVPTPTPGPLTAPSPLEAGLVLLPVVAALFAS
jgi:hypothetical protein